MSGVGDMANDAPTGMSVGDVGVGGTVATGSLSIVDVVVVATSCGLLLRPIIEYNKPLMYDVFPWWETPPLALSSLAEKRSDAMVDVD